MADSQDKAQGQKGQQTALIIAGSILFWLAMQWLGPKIGLSGRIAILIDLVVMAALVYALVQAVQMWRARADEG